MKVSSIPILTQLVALIEAIVKDHGKEVAQAAGQAAVGAAAQTVEQDPKVQAVTAASAALLAVGDPARRGYAVPKLQRFTQRVARRPRRQMVPDRDMPRDVVNDDMWRSRLHCPRCKTLCAAEHCRPGRYYIYCERSGCNFNACTTRADGLGSESKT